MRVYHLVLIALALRVPESHADVTEFNSRNAWTASAGSFTTLDFTGFPQGTHITTQYQDAGALFTDGFDVILLNHNSFPNDGSGLYGAIDSITVEFDKPLFAVAADFPGDLQMELYSDGRLIYASNVFWGGGVGFFGGLVSTDPFDEVRIFDPLGGVLIDDLHFGPPIPAPSALALLALVLFRPIRRRGGLRCGIAV